MDVKAAAEREESRKREIAATQLGEQRVSEATRTAQKEVARLEQHHAALLQVEQAKAAALVNAANERAREVQEAATKKEQEIRDSIKKFLEQKYSGKSSTIDFYQKILNLQNGFSRRQYLLRSSG